MENTIFRKKSLDTISSPEQLNDYIRVTTPSVWIILGAIVALLIGVCIWGVFGCMETSINSGVVCTDGAATLYLSEENIENVQIDNVVKAEGDISGKITKISKLPISYEDIFQKLEEDDYAVHAMGIENENFLYEVKASIPKLQDGVFEVKIITNTVKPMSFVLN